jgi:hypothetical protein
MITLIPVIIYQGRLKGITMPAPFSNELEPIQKMQPTPDKYAKMTVKLDQHKCNLLSYFPPILHISSQLVTVLVTVLSPWNPPGAVMVLNTVIVSICRTVTVYGELPFSVTVLRAVMVVVPTFPFSSVTVRRSVTVAVPPGTMTVVG